MQRPGEVVKVELYDCKLTGTFPENANTAITLVLIYSLFSRTRTNPRWSYEHAKSEGLDPLPERDNLCTSGLRCTPLLRAHRSQLQQIYRSDKRLFYTLKNKKRQYLFVDPFLLAL